jgi:[ribosomal protein S18]-alanine N-acetyltransferase
VTEFRLTPLSSEDLQAVSMIEQDGGDVGWTHEHFRQELANRRARFLVLRADGEVAGYGGFWELAPEAQITNLVVARKYRRQGLGRKLLTQLIDDAREKGCDKITLELRAGNKAALRLYETTGFRQVGRRPLVYQNPHDDALLMEKRL